MFTVVHLTAAATSDSDEIVPVHSVVAGLGTAAMNGRVTDRRTKTRDKAIAETVRVFEWTGEFPEQLLSSSTAFIAVYRGA